jgi:hypothetical protein
MGAARRACKTLGPARTRFYPSLPSVHEFDRCALRGSCLSCIRTSAHDRGHRHPSPVGAYVSKPPSRSRDTMRPPFVWSTTGRINRAACSRRFTRREFNNALVLVWTFNMLALSRRSSARARQGPRRRTSSTSSRHWPWSSTTVASWRGDGSRIRVVIAGGVGRVLALAVGAVAVFVVRT